MQATWEFGLLIIPLLFGGVFLTGFVGGLIPEKVVAGLVGGESLVRFAFCFLTVVMSALVGFAFGKLT